MPDLRYLHPTILAGVLLATSAPVSAQQRYDFEMFQVPGAHTTYIYGINNHGGIVGSYWTNISSRNEAYPFRRYLNGWVESPLRNPEGGYVGENPRICCPFARAINNLGEIAGFDGGDGFLLQNGTLSTIRHGPVTQILGLNDRGDYVALYTAPSGRSIPMAYLDGQKHEFDGRRVRLWGVAWDRTVVGSEDMGGFLQGPEGGRLNIHVEGSIQTILKGINNHAGKIIGIYLDPAYMKHSFVWNYVPDLTPSVMARAQSQSGSMRYTLLRSSISEIVVPGARDVEVNGINASGMIVGKASYTYDPERSFIATPLP